KRKVFPHFLVPFCDPHCPFLWFVPLSLVKADFESFRAVPRTLVIRKLKPELQAGRSPRALGWATEVGRVMGTASYMSPDQVLGQRAEAASDIFTLGCVLYETVAGVRPFAGRHDWPLWI